ncbi:hypothetical protein AC249_AIPGENE26305 [Exaiptasia diaphana]|nr:hypothetical protein AC249_AIPGENE26305 [Exaiptasia diaphana]
MLYLRNIPVKIFDKVSWCKEENIQTPMERMAVGQLDTNLRRFYAEARKKDGQEYSKKTLIGFRHGIERHLNQPPNNKSLQIVTDLRFQRSNQMLDAKIVQLKRSGKETSSKHKPPIESDDLQKRKTSEALSISNPVSLLRNVWFHVVLFFCRRGREGQRQLKTTSFKFEKDAAGRNYITMTQDEITKCKAVIFVEKLTSILLKATENIFLY